MFLFQNDSWRESLLGLCGKALIMRGQQEVASEKSPESAPCQTRASSRWLKKGPANGQS